MIEILRVPCVDRSGNHIYSIRMLHEFGWVGDQNYLNPEKVAEIWKVASQHDVLFSDYTKGKIEPFLEVLMNQSSVWLEIYRVGDALMSGGTVGVAYITGVIPNFDAKGHFAFWDKIAGGREGIIWSIMSWMFERYRLRRISAEVPPYQSGVIRFVRNLGFKQEGEKREAVLYKGTWMPLVQFGILVSEFEKLFEEFTDKGGENGAIRQGEEWNSNRDESRNG